MLETIAANGTPAQRNMAVQTLVTSAEMRGRRLALSEYLAAAMRQAAPGGKSRLIYDAKTGVSLPGTLVRQEGDAPTADAAVNEAYDGSGATYDLFKEVYSRDSIDGGGMQLKSTVHYRKGYDNAFWNGEQMVYGDGDEDLPEQDRLFNRFTISIDIIGHELTHGVTQFEAKLVYSYQPGALNESMSDVFGSLVKQRVRNQSAVQADWIIGEGLFTPNVNGVGIRSMKEPGTAYNDPVLGKDPQPGHMKDYVNTTSDNGGVHINSGIPNRAFYITAMELGGYAWEKAGQIWYVTLRDKLTANSQFQDCANLTYLTAGELFGKGSIEQLAVKKGWADVGITVDDGTTPPPPPPEPGGGCLESLLRLIGAAPAKSR
ncbi:MAG: M4 family metallopeptidase [Chloroflexi bacterium]|nr:M4 family metallopeptidase [Chloroflexota bacterium]MBI5703626.1 M4 family metallopeptidase [Chloroflexota bacterium]